MRRKALQKSIRLSRGVGMPYKNPFALPEVSELKKKNLIMISEASECLAKIHLPIPRRRNGLQKSIRQSRTVGRSCKKLVAPSEASERMKRNPIKISEALKLANPKPFDLSEGAVDLLWSAFALGHITEWPNAHRLFKPIEFDRFKGIEFDHFACVVKNHLGEGAHTGSPVRLFYFNPINFFHDPIGFA